ncbi:hypothetical protein SH449x_004493 [Pirellulaceae bacterium SH449]
MTRAEYITALRRSRCWAWTAYSTISIAIMLLLFSAWYAYFPQIHALSMVFHDRTKNLQDDGYYGAIMGLVFGVTFLLPSGLLPLLPYVWLDRRLGVACSHCNSSLTLYRRSDHILTNGTCIKCGAFALACEVHEPK